MRSYIPRNQRISVCVMIYKTIIVIILTKSIETIEKLVTHAWLRQAVLKCESWSPLYLHPLLRTNNEFIVPISLEIIFQVDKLLTYVIYKNHLYYAKSHRVHIGERSVEKVRFGNLRLAVMSPWHFQTVMFVHIKSNSCVDDLLLKWESVVNSLLFHPLRQRSPTSAKRFDENATIKWQFIEKLWQLLHSLDRNTRKRGCLKYNFSFQVLPDKERNQTFAQQTDVSGSKYLIFIRAMNQSFLCP